MPDNAKPSSKSVLLRQRAEAMLQPRFRVESPGNAEILALIHELEVHQIELELQNEELQRAQKEISGLHQEYENLYEFAPCGYITLSSKGIITRCNLSGGTLLGAEKKGLIGFGFSSFVAPEMRDNFWTALKLSGQTKEKQSVQLKLSNTDNNLWILADIQADQTASGEISQWRLTLADITERKLAEEALRQRELFIREILDSLTSNIVVLDEKYNIVAVNKAWENFAQMNNSPDHYNFLGKNYLAIIENAAFSSREETIVEALRGLRAVMDGSQNYFSLEYPCHSSQEQRWFLMHISPLGGGYRGLVIAHENITERKQTEEALQTSLMEKEVLLREVHHRVKNNLAAISGLIQMQKREISDAAAVAALKQLETRIKSMSIVYEKLYQSKNLAQINFQDYLEDLIFYIRTSLVSRDDISFRVAAPGVELVLDDAIPCGLIVAELITNAIKYAFPEASHCSRGGNCEIAVTMECSDGAYTLTFVDNGIGFPANAELTTTTTLGLHLVRMIGEHQLGGLIEFEYTNGVRFVLKFNSKKKR